MSLGPHGQAESHIGICLVYSAYPNPPLELCTWGVGVGTAISIRHGLDGVP